MLIAHGICHWNLPKAPHSRVLTVLSFLSSIRWISKAYIIHINSRAELAVPRWMDKWICCPLVNSMVWPHQCTRFFQSTCQLATLSGWISCDGAIRSFDLKRFLCRFWFWTVWQNDVTHLWNAQFKRCTLWKLGVTSHESLTLCLFRTMTAARTEYCFYVAWFARRAWWVKRLSWHVSGIGLFRGIRRVSISFNHIIIIYYNRIIYSHLESFVQTII